MSISVIVTTHISISYRTFIPCSGYRGPDCHLRIVRDILYPAGRCARDFYAHRCAEAAMCYVLYILVPAKRTLLEDVPNLP